ncbi:hypothetical protein BC940DRAFT_133924 [Gongronella butleri]|nr:hypothetical protein BC940DRAFT_133924 [Gongronella butleri]
MDSSSLITPPCEQLYYDPHVFMSLDAHAEEGAMSSAQWPTPPDTPMAPFYALAPPPPLTPVATPMLDLVLPSSTMSMSDSYLATSTQWQQQAMLLKYSHCGTTDNQACITDLPTFYDMTDRNMPGLCHSADMDPPLSSSSSVHDDLHDGDFAHQQHAAPDALVKQVNVSLDASLPLFTIQHEPGFSSATDHIKKVSPRLGTVTPTPFTKKGTSQSPSIQQKGQRTLRAG